MKNNQIQYFSVFLRVTMAVFLSFNYSLNQFVSGQASAALSWAESSRQAHEISVYGGGGLSSLRYQLSLSGDKVNVSGGFGGDFGIGYTRFFVSNWGIHTGAGIGIYNSKTALDGVKAITPNLADSDLDNFDMHTVMNNFNESQHVKFLNIPVMVHFQSNLEQGFYVLGGVKAGIPLGGKYTSSCAKLTNSGFYPKFGNWATDQEFAGFGDFDDRRFDGKLKFDVSLMFALEAGMKLNMGRGLSLYAGAYFDLGLNNAAHDNSLPFVVFAAENASEFATNSVLSSLAEKANVMAAGVKLRLAFRM